MELNISSEYNPARNTAASTASDIAKASPLRALLTIRIIFLDCQLNGDALPFSPRRH